MSHHYQPYDPRLYPQPQQPYYPPPHPQQFAAPQQYQYQQHPQYAQPRSSIGHPHPYPPVAPSAWQAQAVQVQAHAGRPLPAPRRADTLPPAPYQPQQPYSQHPGPPARANSFSATSRPLPTPTPSSIQPQIPRSPGRHHSLDLGRPPTPPEKPVLPQTQSESPSQIRRRASPPRFTGGSGSWTDVPAHPTQPSAPPSPAATISKASELKDLLSGPPAQLEGGKFVPLWKRGLLTNGSTPAPSSSRPLPTPSKTPAAPASGLKRGGSLHVRSPASTAREKSPTPSPEPSDDESESDSDAETRTSATESKPDDSEDESESEASEEAHEREVVSPVSPTYGIRDLPRPPSMDSRASTSARPQPPQMRNSTFEGRSAPGMMEKTPGSSRTLMFATAGLADAGGRPSGWPAGVPPLPRTPGSTIKRDVGDLEDSPPVSSMRRGPSSSGISGLPGSPLRSPSTKPTPTFSFSGPPSTSNPPPPTFALNGSSPTSIPSISLPDDSPPSAIPQINLPGDDDDGPTGPSISVEDVDTKPNRPPQIFEVPGISFTGGVPSQGSQTLPANPPNPRQLRGIACGGCDKYIVGRIVNAMGLRWHPECFRCSVCSELLEHVSSYERDGHAYCHLDYHENFAPRCFSCKTPIVDESFISLDDAELGRRTYHEQHFFCAECGDPFLPPSQPKAKGELAFSGDGAFMSDDVGFTVYKGYPYCEACHVRLRLPKCKKCKRSIRDHDQAVEALGGKWCWACFCCAGCDKPFETPAFFERNGKPWCEPCFSIILRNEL